MEIGQTEKVQDISLCTKRHPEIEYSNEVALIL